jgi:hypothetical protein
LQFTPAIKIAIITVYLKLKMDSLKDLAKIKKFPVKHDPKLHSSAHVLADELCNKFNDKKHFGLYLKMSVTYPHDYLRKIAGEVLEVKNVQTPGRLFSYMVKKRNDEIKATNSPTQ